MRERDGWREGRAKEIGIRFDEQGRSRREKGTEGGVDETEKGINRNKGME